MRKIFFGNILNFDQLIYRTSYMVYILHHFIQKNNLILDAENSILLMLLHFIFFLVFIRFVYNIF